VYEGLGMVPIVRVPSPDPYQVSMVLDGGARGVVAPYIETTEQARMLRQAAKLRPLRGEVAHRAAMGEPLEHELQTYVNAYNAQTLLIVNIESVPAIEALDSILEVPEIDAVLIGPHDMTCSLGVPEQYGHPRFREAVGTVFAKARSKGIGAGIHYSGDPALQVDFAKAGANMIIHSSDINVFTRHLPAELNAIRQAMGDVASERDQSGAEPI
jgi:2-keto-3-deoxy-L-rhamnonate aldolase RhmA